MFAVLPMIWILDFFTEGCGKFQYCQTTLWGMQSQKLLKVHNIIYSTYLVLQVSICPSFKERLKSICISILSSKEESWPSCTLWRKNKCPLIWVLIDFVVCDLSRHWCNHLVPNWIQWSPHILLNVQVNVLSSQQDVCEFMSSPTPAPASHRDHQSC